MGDCFCASIPQVENQTEILILQHRRERFHAFNTARIVHKGLKNSRLIVTHTRQAETHFPFTANTGLLYPGPGAKLLDDLPPSERPDQLVVLDGTWHHTKTFLRDIPALKTLPRYQLAPVEPSRYRIRREPTLESLSTIEATVAALRALEPNTPGLTNLLIAFDEMVERQLAHPKASARWHRNTRRSPLTGNIPFALFHNLQNVVVAYGESAAGARGDKRVRKPPVFWVAERLGTGETFAAPIQPDGVDLSDSFLSHLQLSREHFASAKTLQEVQAAWQNFRRPTDHVVVYNPSTAHLFSYVDTSDSACLVLKSVELKAQLRHQSLEDQLHAWQVPIPSAKLPGRAGHRLACAIALTHHLSHLFAAQDLS